jgi:DNA adenine methylase
MQAPSREASPPPKPVLKWAGGKRRLAARIVAKFPERIGTYFEPFLGSAAVFFHLSAQERIGRAVLSDNNAALIEVYRALRSDVQRLMRVLGHKRFRVFGEEAYYEIRGLDPEELDPFERAARTIYLNKTGYNGLYRLNRSGQFNVPFGRYERPTIFVPEALLAASRALQKAELSVGDFEGVAGDAVAGDAVYFDPPYVPVSRTSSFTAYSHEAFGQAEHERLARVFAKLSQRGVPAVLSNSDTRWTRSLYENFDVESIMVARPINSDATRRGGVGELLVRNLKKSGTRSATAATPRKAKRTKKDRPA